MALNKFFWGLGIGDWGLGIGDWGLGPIPNLFNAIFKSINYLNIFKIFKMSAKDLNKGNSNIYKEVLQYMKKYVK